MTSNKYETNKQCPHSLERLSLNSCNHEFFSLSIFKKIDEIIQRHLHLASCSHARTQSEQSE